MSSLPSKLQSLLETFDSVTDAEERAMLLVSFADRFREVPPEIAVRPFPNSQRVEYCESEAYVWAIPLRDGRIKLWFAIENPSGVSAKALSAILDETLSGSTPAEIASIATDIVGRIFRQNISMGKGMGLTGIVEKVRTLARRHVAEPSREPAPAARSSPASTR